MYDFRSKKSKLLSNNRARVSDLVFSPPPFLPSASDYEGIRHSVASGKPLIPNEPFYFVLLHSNGEIETWNIVPKKDENSDQIAGLSIVRIAGMDVGEKHGGASVLGMAWCNQSVPMVSLLLSDGGVRTYDHRLTSCVSPMEHHGNVPERLAPFILDAPLYHSPLLIPLRSSHFTLFAIAVMWCIDPQAFGCLKADAEAKGGALVIKSLLKNIDNERSDPFGEESLFRSLGSLVALFPSADFGWMSNIMSHGRFEGQGNLFDLLSWCKVLGRDRDQTLVAILQYAEDIVDTQDILPFSSSVPGTPAVSPGGLPNVPEVFRPSNLKSEGCREWESVHIPPILWASQSIRKSAVDRGLACVSSRASYRSTRDTISQHILLGNKPSVVQMLHETPTDHPRFLVDALTACVSAASISQESFLLTIKVVADRLIDSDHVDEGLELYCLANRQLDSVRTLKSLDRWEDALFLSSVSETTPLSRNVEILSGVSDQMASSGDTMGAALVAIAANNYPRAARIFRENNMLIQAYIVLHLGEKRGLVTLEEHKTLIEQVGLDLGALLWRMGLLTTAHCFWKRAGEEGKRFIEIRHYSETK